MEDKLLEMCKKTLKIQNSFSEVECIYEGYCKNCPFDFKNNGKKENCTSLNKDEAIQLAQKYIKEHEKTVNAIEKIEEKNKYKIGDKVRVKSDLKADIPYSRVWANHTMLEEKNEILTIEKIVGNKEYRVEENQWLWGEDMFEPVEETVTLKELQEIKKDNIIPTYYHRGSYDVIEFCNKYEIGFVTGNIIKYIVRYKYKNGIEDLKKAREYINRRYVESIEINEEDKIKFYEENNLSYKQGIIIDLILDNCHKKAEEMIDKLIKYEEKKESDINE